MKNRCPQKESRLAFKRIRTLWPMVQPDSPLPPHLPTGDPPVIGGGAVPFSTDLSRESRSFPETRWSRVMLARGHGPEAEQALEDVCRTYWFPLYAFVRRSGRSPADAQDLTQGFFCEIFLNGLLDQLDCEKGRLRSYLLGAIKNFTYQQRRKENAIKRGGGVCFVSIDEEAAEFRYRNDPVDHLSPDHLFDRRWAMELLRRSFDRLGRGLCPEQTLVFREIAPYLSESRGEVPYSDLAERLGMGEGAVRVALHRLRVRHREVLIQVVAETVESPDLVNVEIRHLIASFD